MVYVVSNTVFAFRNAHWSSTIIPSETVKALASIRPDADSLLAVRTNRSLADITFPTFVASTHLWVGAGSVHARRVADRDVAVVTSPAVVTLTALSLKVKVLAKALLEVSKTGCANCFKSKRFLVVELVLLHRVIAVS